MLLVAVVGVLMALLMGMVWVRIPMLCCVEGPSVAAMLVPPSSPVVVMEVWADGLRR